MSVNWISVRRACARASARDAARGEVCVAHNIKGAMLHGNYCERRNAFAVADWIFELARVRSHVGKFCQRPANVRGRAR